MISLSLISSTLNAQENSANPIVILSTSKGDLEIELFPDVAPLAVENFMTHIKNGYYNGVAFHRIIKDFMIQGGDPTESGAGGESIWHKDFKDEFKDKTFDKAGILAMANRGPFTNGSQFFITTAPTPWLNGHHTIFGQISKTSYQTLQKLNNTPVRGSKPIKRVQIDKAFIKNH
ncbi:MAG: peptidylprolyl isomerase [Sulfurimonas sp.]|nr:peptidylprolyl isomerase [Sulfurimonas sp.]MDQ7067171.1 peptidylprolyl isomerase [Sulfurimonas sp.]